MHMIIRLKTSVLVYILLNESEKQRRNRVVARKTRAVSSKPARERAIFTVFVAYLHRVRDLCGLK